MQPMCVYEYIKHSVASYELQRWQRIVVVLIVTLTTPRWVTQLDGLRN